MAQSYEKAGVNLEAGYEVVRRIKKHVASTSRLGVMGNIGAFGGMFDLSALKVKEPVLVSGTDGVGTKLKLAFEMDKHDTIGIDAVAMCVNDVLAQGAEPLVFLDYVAVGRNEPQKIEAIVAGVADGCRQAGCALVGGETAEMPGMYAEGEYAIAGQGGSRRKVREAIELATPVEGIITGKFDIRQGNFGVKIAATAADRITAIDNGTVVQSLWTPETGYIVVLQHAGNLISVYKNLSQSLVTTGQTIRSGELIGYNAEVQDGEVRLFEFELWNNGKPVDPEGYIVF